jgi:hypothetical protein
MISLTDEELIKLARARHAKRENSNYYLEKGTHDSVAVFVNGTEKGSKRWFAGSAYYAILPPIECSDMGLLVDWYFVRIGISPRAIDTEKPEATAFYCGGYGTVRHMESDEIRHARTILKAVPHAVISLEAIHKRVLGKVVPGIQVRGFSMPNYVPEKRIPFPPARPSLDFMFF